MVNGVDNQESPSGAEEDSQISISNLASGDPKAGDSKEFDNHRQVT